jgi:hypothetical protein
MAWGCVRLPGVPYGITSLPSRSALPGPLPPCTSTLHSAFVVALPAGLELWRRPLLHSAMTPDDGITLPSWAAGLVWRSTALIRTAAPQQGDPVGKEAMPSRC